LIKRSEIVKIPVNEFFLEENYWKLKEMIRETIEAVKSILLGYGHVSTNPTFTHEETYVFINYLINYIESEFGRDQLIELDIDAMITADNTILLCFKHLRPPKMKITKERGENE
jgi:hypothetical protein